MKDPVYQNLYLMDEEVPLYSPETNTQELVTTPLRVQELVPPLLIYKTSHYSSSCTRTVTTTLIVVIKSSVYSHLLRYRLLPCVLPSDVRTVTTILVYKNSHHYSFSSD